MIMPADPRIGNVYRPENIPGLVFEEVTVKSIDETVGGPKGPVSGAVFIQERLQDGTLENKIFAPGYGEFQAEVKTEDEFYGVAVVVPTDALQRAPSHARHPAAVPPPSRHRRASHGHLGPAATVGCRCPQTERCGR